MLLEKEWEGGEHDIGKSWGGSVNMFENMNPKILTKFEKNSY